jgi:hypothetical protein
MATAKFVNVVIFLDNFRVIIAGYWLKLLDFSELSSL